MASHFQPNPLTFEAGGTIPKGAAVKFSGVTGNIVVICTANTDEVIGIALDSATVGLPVEVALPGGGAKILCGEAIALGKQIVPGAGGAGFQSNASGDKVIAIAMESGVLNDIISVHVVRSIATAADQ